MLLAPIGVLPSTLMSELQWHDKMFPLSDKNQPLLGNKNSEIQLIIIEKISMVPSKLLF